MLIGLAIFSTSVFGSVPAESNATVSYHELYPKNMMSFVFEPNKTCTQGSTLHFKVMHWKNLTSIREHNQEMYMVSANCFAIADSKPDWTLKVDNRRGKETIHYSIVVLDGLKLKNVIDSK